MLKGIFTKSAAKIFGYYIAGFMACWWIGVQVKPLISVLNKVNESHELIARINTRVQLLTKKNERDSLDRTKLFKLNYAEIKERRRSDSLLLIEIKKFGTENQGYYSILQELLSFNPEKKNEIQ